MVNDEDSSEKGWRWGRKGGWISLDKIRLFHTISYYFVHNPDSGSTWKQNDLCRVLSSFLQRTVQRRLPCPKMLQSRAPQKSSWIRLCFAKFSWLSNRSCRATCGDIQVATGQQNRTTSCMSVCSISISMTEYTEYNIFCGDNIIYIIYWSTLTYSTPHDCWETFPSSWVCVCVYVFKSWSRLTAQQLMAQHPFRSRSIKSNHSVGLAIKLSVLSCFIISLQTLLKENDDRYCRLGGHTSKHKQKVYFKKCRYIYRTATHEISQQSYILYIYMYISAVSDSHAQSSLDNESV